MVSLSPKRPDASDGVGGTLLFGYSVIGLAALALGGWAATTSLAAAVIAEGNMVVESNVKEVQHPNGGVIGEILVREGATVKAGDVLVLLDQTTTHANLQIIAAQLERVLVRKAILMAEHLGLADPEFPEALKQASRIEEILDLLDKEGALMQSRKRLLEARLAQLAARKTQLSRQIDGLKAQKLAADTAYEFTVTDLKALDELQRKKLVGLARVSEVRLESVRLGGEAGRLAALIAETEGRMSEVAIHILQIEEDHKREILDELRELEGQEMELSERKLVAEAQLARDTILAPQDGVVQQLAIHTVGGVISPGQVLMSIVPTSDQLVIEARVTPVSVDDVRAGQPVTLRFPGFNASTTPQCAGTVRWISADLLQDSQQQRASHFLVRIDTDEPSACLGKGDRILPGMPVEVYIKTGERSVWSYFWRPLTDQAARAFKET